MFSVRNIILNTWDKIRGREDNEQNKVNNIDIGFAMRDVINGLLRPHINRKSAKILRAEGW